MGEHLTFYTELKSLLNARGSFKITPLKFKDKWSLKETLMPCQRLIKITFVVHTFLTRLQRPLNARSSSNLYFSITKYAILDYTLMCKIHFPISKSYMTKIMSKSGITISLQRQRWVCYNKNPPREFLFRLEFKDSSIKSFHYSAL